jgi:acylphosphatase
VKSEENESDILTKNAMEKILEGHAKNVRNGTVMAWMDYENTIEIVATAWRENVEMQESDDLWTEVCQRPSKKSSLRKPKCDG